MAQFNYKIGDIISAHFPQNHAPNVPGPKRRPCVVVGNCQRTDGIYVVYGTDLEHTSNKNGGLEIATPQDLKVAGLEKPTRVVLDRIAKIPNNSNYISAHNKKGGKLGRLPRRQMDELQGILKKSPIKFLDADPTAELFPVLMVLTRGWQTYAHGVVLEEGGPCPTLRIGDLAVEFWPVQPGQELDLSWVTREMVEKADKLTGTGRLECLARMDDLERRLAS